MGDTEAAESLLSASLDVETASSGMIRVAALAQAGVGDTKQALATLDRALQARPNDVTLLAMQGLLALSIPEREQEGYRSLQKALSIEPQHSRLRLALARYHYWKGEDEQGMAQLRTAFKYQPADWMVTDTYINLLLVQQQLAEIESVVAELKTAAPKAREVVLYEAQLIYRRGDRNAAIQKLQNLLSSNSAFEQGHAVLAQMQWEAGQLENALGSIERVLQINPANRQALRAGAGLLAGRSGGLSPQEWLQQMADKYAESIELTRNSAGLRAMLYRDEGKLDQAVAALSGYEGTENEYLRQVKSTIYRDQATRSVGRADFSRAREQLLNALALFPQSKTLNLDLARVEIGAKRFGEAKALLDDIESRFPEDPEVITVRAGVVRAEQGAGPAYQLLSQAWEQRPHTFMAPLLVSLATSEAPSAVAGILARWEAIAPDDRARLLYVASWHQQQNNNADAIQAYEQILDDNPQDAIVLNNLAWLLKDSDLSRAAAYAKSAAELQPKVASILDTYGWLLHLQGKNEQALQYLERAVELAPEVSDIRQHRDQVRAAL
jgi:Tfp pilus assembly protein PilF